MSHFSVLVIGDDPEGQLSKFKFDPGEGSPLLVFNDQTERYKHNYQTETYPEFECSSSSSWGLEITRELFEMIQLHEAGFEVIYPLCRINGMFEIIKLGGKYKGYYKLENRSRCEGSQWFEVIEVLTITKEGNGPGELMEGTVRIKKIAPPEIYAIKDYYKTFDSYMQKHLGIQPNDKGQYGTFENPDAQWDWYIPGGRWGGLLKLKPGAANKNGGENGLYQAIKNDICNLNDVLTFSVVMNGTWYQQGETGWWGDTSGAKNERDWEPEYRELLNSLPADTLLSVFDCHL